MKINDNTFLNGLRNKALSKGLSLQVTTNTSCYAIALYDVTNYPVKYWHIDIDSIKSLELFNLSVDNCLLQCCIYLEVK